MKITEIIKKLNCNRNISLDHVMDIKRRYLGLYKATLLKLYDLGYASDPTCLNIPELSDLLHSNDSESFKDFINNKEYLSIGLGGKEDWSSKHFGYLKIINTDKEIKKFAGLLEELFYYREQCKQIDNFYEYYKKKLKDKKPIKMDIFMVGSSINTKGSFNICESVIECFEELQEDEEIKYYDISEIIYNKVCELLGSKNGLLVGVSREDEIKYLDQFLNGKERIIKCIDKTGKLLNKLRESVWSEEITYRNSKVGLFDKVLRDFAKVGEFPIEEVLEKCIKDVGIENIVGVSTERVYYKTKVEYKKYPIGGFILLSSLKDMIIENNLFSLDGVSGELYDVEALDKQGINYRGCPIKVRYYNYFDDLIEYVCVDIEQTEYFTEEESLNTWFSLTPTQVEFQPNTYKVGIFTENTCEEELYRLLCDYEAGKTVGNLSTRWSYNELERKKHYIFQKFLRPKVHFITK